MVSKDTFVGILLFGLGFLAFGFLIANPSERWPAAHPREDLPRHTLVYAGPEAITIPGLGLDTDMEARAMAALRDATYHAAYAEGPAGRTGLWTGAHTSELARRYALAACGAECRVLAERRPLQTPDVAAENTLILSHDMASRVGAEWPFLSGGDALAIGGASAWLQPRDAGRGAPARSGSVRPATAPSPAPRLYRQPPCRIVAERDASNASCGPQDRPDDCAKASKGSTLR
jgi:hypothetical protein